MKRDPFVLLLLLISGCRYLAPAMPEVSPERPALLSSGNTTEPSRQQQQPGRPCVIDCGPGKWCNEKTAQCEVARAEPARDAGVPWLP
jgi:hypothetical protein